ncbi:MAG: hypothetical protein JNM43_29655, partial [Planctomycetaceae bacterium]|nr:hypothetical protein [Planctomycetaceae bacterium]
MSSYLPDDLASWPLAPSQVLNVSTTADKAEIRRAYATLIRRFRPETHPAHFQRLREAMEILLAELQRGGSPVAGGLDLAPVVSPVSGELKPSKSDAAKSPQNDNEVAAPFRDRAASEGKSPANDADQLWEEYSRSPSAVVVQKIHALALSLRDDVTPFLMGYWTSKLTPTLCPDLSPLRWLTDGLERFGGDAELVRLLVAELKLQPGLLDSKYTGHLSERILNSANLQVYLSERWQLLAAKGDWKQLEQESEEARRRLAFSHPGVWFHLLSRIYELGILAEHSDGRYLARKLFDEMEAMTGGSNTDRAMEYVETLRFIAKCFEAQDPSSSAELNVLI